MVTLISGMKDDEDCGSSRISGNATRGDNDNWDYETDQ
jgi:hypothetical protein